MPNPSQLFLAPGNTQDQPPSSRNQSVERAIASLVLALLKNKFPDAEQFVVGFQLLDYNEDVNEGTGFIVLKLGNFVGYIPVIFDKGDVRGMDIMYVKDINLYLPAASDWLKMILAQQNIPMGKEVQKNLPNLTSVPDTSRALLPPTKQAAWHKYSNYYKNLNFGKEFIKRIKSKEFIKQAFKIANLIYRVHRPDNTFGPLFVSRPFTINGTGYDFIKLLWDKCPDGLVKMAEMVSNNIVIEKYAYVFYGKSPIWQKIYKEVKFYKEAAKKGPSSGVPLALLLEGSVPSVGSPVEDEEDEKERERATIIKSKKRKKRSR